MKESDFLSENARNMYIKEERTNFDNKLKEFKDYADDGDEEMKKINDDYFKYTTKRAEILVSLVSESFWKHGRAINTIASTEEHGIYSFVIAANMTRSDYERMKSLFLQIRNEILTEDILNEKTDD